jgi:hypothetical protein
LRRRRLTASNTGGRERNIELRGQRARDLFDLVVAALAKPRGVQRHGDQSIGRESSAVELGGEQEP